jgi:hypothetical protein
VTLNGGVPSCRAVTQEPEPGLTASGSDSTPRENRLKPGLNRLKPNGAVNGRGAVYCNVVISERPFWRYRD